MLMEVSDLIGAGLDYAVAVADGRTEIKVFAPSSPRDRGFIEVRFNPDRRAATARFDPSINWAQGGPIIEREKITLSYGLGIRSNLWFAEKYQCYAAGRNTTSQQYGPTPLIAAMRCYVASKLGNTVEIPD